MQVTSLQLSEKIAVWMGEVEPSMHWVRHRRNKHKKWDSWTLMLDIFDTKDDILWQHIPAYTLDEVLSRLPKVIDDFWELTMISNDIQMAFGYKNITNCFFDYSAGGKPFFSTPIENFNPAEAAGQLLKFCGDEGYLEANYED